MWFGSYAFDKNTKKEFNFTLIAYLHPVKNALKRAVKNALKNGSGKTYDFP